MKQKILPLLLALLTAYLPASAYDFMVDDLYYNINSDGTSVTVTYENPGYPNYSNLNGDLTIPSSVTNDGSNYSVTSIGNDAFKQCYGLTSVTIPNSVTSFGNGAFGFCVGLTSFTIPNSVTSIGNYAFWSCGLTSVTIPNSVTSIGDGVFESCRDLTSVTIPNSVTSIGRYAFRLTGLTSVNIPNSVTSIGDEAFRECDGLTSIVVNSGNTKYDSRNNCNAIIETSTNTLIAGCMNTVIPNSVTSIGNSAFYGCTGLTSVTIPNSVTSIDDYAFCGCSGLTSVTIPNSVTSIGNLAFYLCMGLTSLTIPNSVTSIGGYAFFYCISLTSITIPNSVTSIGNEAFSYCNNLADFYTYIENPSSVSLGSDVFMNVPTTTCLLHVPTGTTESYRAADQWSAFTNIVEDMTSIDNIATDHKSDGIYYNLLGQPVKNPTTGIYIYNGKKVFKK